MDKLEIIKQFVAVSRPILRAVPTKPHSEQLTHSTEQQMRVDDVVTLIIQQMKDDEWDKALSSWERLVKAIPDDLNIKHALAESYLALGMRKSAVAVYRELVRTTPDNLDIRIVLAAEEEQLGRWEPALAQWEKILQIRPNLYLGYLASSRLFYRLDKPQQAIAMGRTCVRLLPGDREGYAMLARAYNRVGRWSDALKAWGAVLPIDGGDTESRIWSARLMIRTGREKEGLALFDEIKSKQSHAAKDSQLVFARIAENAEFIPESFAMYRTICAKDKKDYSSRKEFASLLLKYGMLGDAFSVIQQAKMLGEEDSACLSQLETQMQKAARFAHLPPDDAALLLPEVAISALVEACLQTQRRHVRYKKHIVHVSQSLGAGGAERQLVAWLKASSHTAFNDYELSLLCEKLETADDKDFFIQHLSGVPVTIKEYGYHLGEKLSKDAITSSRLIDGLELIIPKARQLAILNLTAEFIKIRPAIVQAWQDEAGIAAAIAAAIVGIPHIIIRVGSLRPGKLRDNSPRYQHNRRYMYHAYQALLQLPGIVLVANSDAGALDYEQWLNRPKGSVKVIKNGIDLSELDGRHTHKNPVKHEVLSNTPIVGGIMRFTNEKRPLLWIQIAAQIATQRSDVHFVVLGDGPLKHTLSTMAHDHGFADRLHLPGRVQNVQQWLASFSVLLQSSRVEGLPNAIIESQYAGIPVVASNAGGTGETFLNKKSGWLISDDCVEQYAEKIIWILNNPEWKRQASESARQFALNHFSMARLAKDIEDLYDTLLHPR